MKTTFSVLLASAAIATGIVATSIAAPAYANRPGVSQGQSGGSQGQGGGSQGQGGGSQGQSGGSQGQGGGSQGQGGGSQGQGGGSTSTTGVCKLGDVSYNLSASIVNATACIGELEIGSPAWNYNNDVLGNGDPLLSQLNNLFNVNYKWSFVGKDESTTSAANGFDGFSATKTGNWSVSQALTGPFAISLKAGDGFSVYFFDNIKQAVSSGAWSTAGIINNGGSQPELSHVSLFKAEVNIVPPPPKKAPEPATILGLGLVASGMVVARRRQAAAHN